MGEGMTKMVKTCLTFLAGVCLMAFCSNVFSQTMGLMQKDSAVADRYTLLAPSAYTSTYLIDNCGRLVHEWAGSLIPGAEVKLEADGILWRTGRMSGSWTTGGGHFEKVDWDGTVLWQYEWADSLHHAHHDFVVLPSGNLLLIAYERHLRSDAISHGLDTAFTIAEIWSEQLIELEPTGTDSATVVWEWHLWDHMVQDFDSSQSGYDNVAAHPELVNINFPGNNTADWIHANTVTYRADVDQIMMSCREMNEIWIIDHSTSSAEAASHAGGDGGKGGDLLYRWGNPAAYQRGSSADQRLFGQHDATWIPDSLVQGGAVMVFNNGAGRPAGPYSSVDVLELPMDSLGHYPPAGPTGWGPDTLLWSYVASPVPTDFYSSVVSGAERLPNGNTLICSGLNGLVFEIDSSENTIWQYINPVTLGGPMTQGNPPTANTLFRAHSYPPGFPAFAGKDMTPGDRIELSPLPLPTHCLATGRDEIALMQHPVLYPNPAKDVIELQGVEPNTRVIVWNMQGQVMAEALTGSGRFMLDCSGWPAGIYAVHVPGERPLLLAKE